MTKITTFNFKNFNFIFIKFETLYLKSHHLTLNRKYKLVKNILIIFFIECYFCDKKF